MARGKCILRFYLVISKTEENVPNESVWVLGISRQCTDPPPAQAVLLPFCPDPKSRPMTGLRQRCAVFVDWYTSISPANIENRCIGHVSPSLFNRILKLFEEFRKK
jgi:hypothetical protein